MCNKVVDLIPVVHHTARPVEAKEELTHFIRDKAMSMAVRLVLTSLLLANICQHQRQLFVHAVENMIFRSVSRQR